MYHLFRYSCTTEVYGLLDDSLIDGKGKERVRFLNSLPMFPEKYLSLRGLVNDDGSSRLPTLNVEKKKVGDPI